ncbi:hypothetical protein HII31_05060, partial [Pseudocercospora fuligena]
MFTQNCSHMTILEPTSTYQERPLPALRILVDTQAHHRIVLSSFSEDSREQVPAMTPEIDSDIESAADMSKQNTDFLHLPNELQLSVLSHLPAKDVQRARRVCKHICALVDEPSNAQLLYTRTCQREYARLQADVSFSMDYSSVGFLDALDRFCEMRGIWSNQNHMDAMLELFAHLWTSQHDRLDPSLCEPAPTPTVVVSIRLREFLRQKRWGIEQYKQISEGRTFTEAFLAPSAMSAIPKWPLTRLVHIDPNDATQSIPHTVALGVCGEAKLAKLLQIPELPAYCSGSFAYCVKLQKTYDLVKAACEKGG